MPTRRKMRGEIVNCDSPNWGPLNALLGLDLSAGFVWMGEVELRNRTRLHAYKHRLTRGYIHVTRDGRCYAYVDESSYRQISQFQAVYGAFDLWGGRDREHDVVNSLTPREQAALEFTRRYASFELLEPGEDTVLLAGPGRFEPLYEPPEWAHIDSDPVVVDDDIPF